MPTRIARWREDLGGTYRSWFRSSGAARRWRGSGGGTRSKQRRGASLRNRSGYMCSLPSRTTAAARAMHWNRGVQVKRLLLLVAFSTACSACTDGGASPDATPAVDGEPGCVPSGVLEADATRSTEAAEVTVSSVLRNALTHCVKAELAFALVFDTHSVDLLAIDIATSARIETSAAADITGALAWAPGSESSHHRDGVLTAPAPSLDGVAWLRLVISDIAGVDRVFEWDATLLAHDLP